MTLAVIFILCIIDLCWGGCDCGRGGLCLEYGDRPSEGISANPCHCNIVSKGIFQPAKNNCDVLVTNHCDRNPCVHGNCVNGFGTFICMCSQIYTVYLGRTCEDNIPHGGYSMFITLWYPITEQKRWKPVFVSKILYSGSRFEFEFEHDRAWTLTQEECKTVTKEEVTAKCGRRGGGPDCAILSMTITTSQYFHECDVPLPFVWDRTVHVDGVTGPVGYYNDVEVEAKDEGHLVHLAAKYRVFLETGKLMRKCPYKVKLYGCGETPSTANRDVSSAPLTISASSPFISLRHICPVKSKSYKWFLSHLHQEGHPREVLQTGQSITIVPTEYGFHMGLMVIMVEVTFQELIDMEDETILMICYINLIEKKMSVSVSQAYLTYMCDVVTNVTVIPNLVNSHYPETELKFEWTCPQELCQGINTKSKILTFETTAACGDTYALKLEVTHTPSNIHVTWEGQLIFVPPIENDIVLIYDPNSKVVNPMLPLTITAMTPSGSLVENCVWYPEIQFDKCRSGVGSHILMIPPNTLEAGRNHSFNVATGSISKNFTVETAAGPHDLNCSVYPNSGLRLHLDQYNLNCTAEASSPPLTYYVFEGDSKLIVLISPNPQMTSISVSDAPIWVDVEDSFGMRATVMIPIKIVPSDDEQREKVHDIISRKIQLLPLLIQDSAFSEVAHEIDEITKCIYTGFPFHQQHTLMRLLSQIVCFWEECIEETINSVRRLLTIEWEDFSNELSGVDEFILNGGDTIYKMTKDLNRIKITIRYAAYTMIPLLSDIHSAAHELLEIVDPQLQHPTLDEGIRRVHYRKVEQGNAYARKAIAKLGLFITNNIPHPAFPFQLISDLTGDETTVISHSPEYINCVDQLNTTKSYFKFTHLAIAELAVSAAGVAITKVLYKKNNFWWSTMANSSLGEMVEIHIYRRNQRTKKWQYSSLPIGPIETYVVTPDFKISTREGIVYEPEQNVTAPNDLDPYVKVYRFTVPRGHGALLLVFPKELVGFLRVVYNESVFPTYQSAAESPILNGTHLAFKYHSEEPRAHVYIGFLTTRGERKYHYNTSLIQCVVQSERTWKSESCLVTGSSEEDLIVCTCEHLSVFSVITSEPIISSITMLNLHLSATNKYTFYVVAMLIAILTLLIVMYCLSTLRWQVKPEGYAMILNDNWPGEEYPYLIAVYTGGRCMSGTSSHVAIRLIGDEAISRVHILTSGKKRSVPLTWGLDCWFILFTTESLGKILYIELWHDHVGCSSDWYCLEVLILDITTGDKFKIPVGSWLNYTNLYKSRDTTFHFEVVDEDRKLKWRSHLFSHIQAKLRQEHHWASVVLIHARSRYTRLDRLVLLIVIVMVTFATAMVFFLFDTGPADGPKLVITVPDLYISAKTVMITSVVAIIIGQIFSFGRNEVISGLSKVKSPCKELMLRMFLHPVVYKQITIKEKYEREKWKWNVWICIAYGVSAGIIYTTIEFVTKFGLNLGENRSIVWFIVSLVALGVEALIINPIQVLVTAILVSCVTERSVRDNVNVTLNPDVDLTLTENENERLDRMFHYRIQPMYKPPTSQKVKDRATFDARRDHFDIYLISVVLLSLVLIPSLVYFLAQQSYHKELEFIRILGNEGKTGKTVTTIRDRRRYLDYLHWTVTKVLHRYTWYNGKPLHPKWEEAFLRNGTLRPTTKYKGLCSDYSTRLVGVPQIRQKRLAPKSSGTVAPEFRQHFQRVDGELKMENEDTKTYLPGWKTPVENETYYTTYRYNFGNETRAAVMYGIGGQAYDSGGYVEHLHWSLGLSISILVDLELDNWLDHLTRSIFLTYNLYSVHEERVSYVTIITECLPSGVYRSRIMSDSASISSKRLSVEYETFFVVLGLVILVTVHLIRALTIISKYGFHSYLRSVSGFVDIIFILIGYALVAALINRYFHYFAALEEIESTIQDNYTPLHWRFNQNDVALVLIGALSFSVSALGTILLYNLIGFEAISIALVRTRALLVVYGGLNLLTIYVFLELCHFGSGDTSYLFFMIYFKESTAIQDVFASHFADILLVSIVAFIILTRLNVAILVHFYAEATALLREPKMFVFKNPISNLRPRVLAIQTLKSETTQPKRKWFKSQIEGTSNGQKDINEGRVSASVSPKNSSV